jgi:hypothetical protein
MENYNNVSEDIKMIIKQAYFRCYGLQDLVKKGTVEARRELCEQTGLRRSFVEDNIKAIQTITI